ncbi:WYL domain-containing protein [Pseudomonas sp.]|uniref:helix-turn-helix transcriptional regulator n=1 Tax=Pseudomonas sp. TaxID=306 RepID=UPI0023539E39|nr:WYL domain-containing protein [Pseudomonas sp.]
MNQQQRQQALLSRLPRKADRKSTSEVCELIRKLSPDRSWSKKTISRDLIALKGQGVRHERVGKTDFWWVDKTLPNLCLLPNDAMNLAMIFDHAKRFGMEAQVNRFTELHQYAKDVLQRENPKVDWSKRITSTTRFMTLQPGTVNPLVLEGLQKALQNNFAVKALYKSANASEPKTYRLKPLGLSYQDSNIYLSCVFAKRPEQLAALPLHRFIKVELALDDIPVPQDYDINSVAARRSLISLDSEVSVNLVVRLRSENLYRRLQENPLSEDQQLSPESEGCWRLVASQFRSQGLDLWLLSQGADLEVLEPSDLRDNIAEKVQQMAALYQQ